MQYHLDELPAIFIVDPITGAKLWQRAGFVSPDALIEELVPFLDVGEHTYSDSWTTTHLCGLFEYELYARHGKAAMQQLSCMFVPVCTLCNAVLY